jgi:hypothetical protein
MAFDEKTIEYLKYYVYFLKDPDSKLPFYIGKGVGNRVFDHLNCALTSETESLKYDKIRNIQETGKTVQHIIVRHSLSEREAFEIEATIIDIFNYLGTNLTNLVSGQRSIEKGLMTTDEIIRLYNAAPLTSIASNCMIININRNYKRGSGEDAIYKATKETWTIAKKRLDSIKIVLSEYKGLIIEVFQVNGWYEKNRQYNPNTKGFKEGRIRIGYGFDGVVAPEEIRSLYLNKSIAHLKMKGTATAIRYNI